MRNLIEDNWVIIQLTANDVSIAEARALAAQVPRNILYDLDRPNHIVKSAYLEKIQILRPLIAMSQVLHDYARRLSSTGYSNITVDC